MSSRKSRRGGLGTGARVAIVASLLAAPLGYLAFRGNVEAPPSRRAAAAQPDSALPGLTGSNAEFTAELDAAREGKGAAYIPRTRHLTPSGAPLYTNRLIFQLSPYLLQHAHNPVNWYAWGPEAFERARRENKPVLLSIGYSTCHWCHVMERESFEDVEIAAFINEHFVAIKVDREERPDVDDTYMDAVRAFTNGRGGWPMTAVLTAEREAFFGGTYFPPRDGARGARKGFLTILRELSQRYQADREGALREAKAVTARLVAQAAPEPPGDVPGMDAITQGANALVASFDSEWGGFGGAPKFPMPVNLELLMRHAHRAGDARARHVVERTLEAMSRGGIYDQIGGGFHRYSVDRTWTVPHFEKMLYDNAQLACAFIDAHQLTGREDFARVAMDTLDYVAREMTDPRGGFYSATDADSLTPQGHEEEGYFFTWTPQEVASVVGGPRSQVVEAYWGVTHLGQLDGRSVLQATQTAADVAGQLGLPLELLLHDLETTRNELLAARALRPAPLRDDKILASWNGLMISAFARAAFVFERADYAEVARAAADFVLGAMRGPDGGLTRTFRDVPGEHAFLDDYAFLIQGLLDLFSTTQELDWLLAALDLQSELDASYADDAGGYFLTSSTHEDALTRTKPVDDGVEPSGNAVAILNQLRLAELTGEDALRTHAEQAMAAFAASATNGRGRNAKLLSALDFLLDETLEIVIVESPTGAASQLLAPLRRSFLPNHVLVVARSEQVGMLAARIPLLEGKEALAGRTTAYVCTRGLCKLPTSDPEVFDRLLRREVGR